MSTTYGVMLKQRNEKHSYLHDATFETPEQAFVEAHGLMKLERPYSPEAQLVMGIFAMDDLGNFSHHLNRREIKDAIEEGEADLEHEEANERKYGSFYSQHALGVSDVVGRA